MPLLSHCRHLVLDGILHPSAGFSPSGPGGEWKAISNDGPLENLTKIKLDSDYVE